MYHAKSILALGLCAGACASAQIVSTQAQQGYSVHLMSAEYNVEGRVVKGAPFSAQITTTSTQTLADGNRIVNNNTFSQARDSEGRTRREQTIKAVGEWATGQNPPAMVFIHDPVAQVSYVLEPNTHNARKMSLASGEPAMMEAAMKKKLDAEKAARSGNVAGAAKVTTGEPAMQHKLAAESNVVSESLGSKVIEGMQVDGRRITRTIPAGQIGNEKPLVITDEIWTSAELNMTVMSRHSDPRSGETMFTLTNIQRAEPDAALFVVPADYTVTEGPGKVELMRRR